MSDKGLDVKSNEVWRTCRKIQAAVVRYGLNLKVELAQFDANNDGFIPESKFVRVLEGYTETIGISSDEIQKVTDYFRMPDGRFAFNEFSKVVCEDDHTKNSNVTQELERADPMHVNPVTNDETLELCTLLTKIARSTVLPLSPYFQDYEMVTRNVGTVTVTHFSRVLHFMRFQLSERELLLLLKRYMKDSYTVNYVAFVSHVDAIAEYLKGKGSDAISNNPVGIIGKLIGLEFPAQTLSNKAHQQTFDFRERPQTVGNAIFRIQRYVYENRIRLTEFLESFDALRTGRITKNQFIRGLDNAGISGCSRLKLSPGEIEFICGRYTDHDLIQWKQFVDDIDRVFTEKNLEKQPQLAVESPQPHIKTIPKQGQKNWQMQEESVRDLCEEALARIQKKVLQRRIYLLPFFKNFDKLNKGHVRPNQAFQALLSNTILVSQEEFDALSERYSNDLGFNYIQFLEEADPAEYALPKLKDPAPLKEARVRAEPCLRNAQPTEQDIIHALATAKRQSQVNNVKLIDFFVDYDHHRENQILETDFRRSLDTANIKLTAPELDVICNVFRSPHRGCTVRYRDFCKALDEIFIQGQSDEKISTPIKHFPCVDCTQCFLNFDERTIASKALQKLSRKPDQVSNLQSLFKDFDKSNCGTITQNQFLRALTVRDMHNMISSREFEIVCKCFGYERGLHIEFNYRDFLDILNILFETGQVKRNL